MREKKNTPMYEYYQDLKRGYLYISYERISIAKSHLFYSKGCADKNLKNK